jgi:hypothetical protein
MKLAAKQRACQINDLSISTFSDNYIKILLMAAKDPQAAIWRNVVERPP